MTTEPVVPPKAYTPSALPLLPGGDGAYMQRELNALKTSLDSIIVLLPQGANKVPPRLVDGMVRFSRQPWWPVAAQAADAWVFWDAVAGSWKYVRTN